MRGRDRKRFVDKRIKKGNKMTDKAPTKIRDDIENAKTVLQDIFYAFRGYETAKVRRAEKTAMTALRVLEALCAGEWQPFKQMPQLLVVSGGNVFGYDERIHEQPTHVAVGASPAEKLVQEFIEGCE